MLGIFENIIYGMEGRVICNYTMNAGILLIGYSLKLPLGLDYYFGLALFIILFHDKINLMRYKLNVKIFAFEIY